jgi:hypothetical protein
MEAGTAAFYRDGVRQQPELEVGRVTDSIWLRAPQDVPVALFHAYLSPNLLHQSHGLDRNRKVVLVELCAKVLEGNSPLPNLYEFLHRVDIAFRETHDGVQDQMELMNELSLTVSRSAHGTRTR